ncbi:DNA-directed RNA polymerase III, subunit Rpc31 [Thelonectria olida]|uniref:DNA-directed RNA polymerase III subunit n=1 Tax=Thelonectria olida TaxID=1576542 RepID=A0A9P9ASA1_9HYPO|nr:DNA-directed RNA polymerase III, subunit Rpc31 [Thelonectria olida]
MSRGGRGGGRGGRGGGRGGRPNVPWDTGDEPDARPSELFPPYVVPNPKTLNSQEISSIQHLLLLRHQIHASPLYTSKRTSLHDPTAPRKLYGQDQMNARYGVKNKASLDPFTAVPTYSHKFVREERALPDWSHRPVCRELFPDELLGTIDAASNASTTPGTYKRRKLELSSISALPSAEEAFGLATDGMNGDEGHNLLDRLDAIKDEEGEGGLDLEDEEGLDEDDQDEVYDDEDAGDYDAENYFDGGEEFGDDYGDDGDGEGTF